ncbi:MAG: universal stress protein [Acidobacteria bacterium]|nr:universal stress protein [Acidobacteriota bacterium]
MKILFAIDDNAISSMNLSFVKNFNLTKNSEFWLISVIDMAITSSPEILSVGFQTTNEIENSFIEKARHNLDRVRKELLTYISPENVQIFTELLTGSPASRILEKAENNNIDLIILGSHYHSALERFILGSVSSPVLHQSKRSVLVFRNN